MDAKLLSQGFAELDELSKSEYRQSLQEVVDTNGDENQRLQRVGRLIGVLMKQPLATPTDQNQPSEYSQAWRSWHLKSQDELDATPALAQTWQYEALETLRIDPDVVKTLGYEPADVRDLANAANYERGFFSFLAVSCRKYLCRDQQLRERIQEEVASGRKAGLDLQLVTPESLAASGSVVVATLLVQAIPVLAGVGAPVIAGLVVIIYNIGIDAFCSWASQSALITSAPAEL